MKITDTEVRYVADLANLALTEDEVKRMATQLDGILTYIDKLNELDTSNVEPMAQVLHTSGDTTLRDDVEGATFTNAVALANAPLSGAGHFKVPKIIEK